MTKTIVIRGYHYDGAVYATKDEADKVARKQGRAIIDWWWDADLNGYDCDYEAFGDDE